jgi:hypothetical protein
LLVQTDHALHTTSSNRQHAHTCLITDFQHQDFCTATEKLCPQ